MAGQFRLHHSTDDNQVNDKIVAKKLAQGDGVYCLSKQDAGLAHKEARRYKLKGEITYWNRRRGKAGK